MLVPLPEGKSYLGFIFARRDTPLAVEQALRAAHAKLRFVIDREIAVVLGRWTSRRIRNRELFCLLGHISRWERRPLAEEEIFHVLADQLLRLFLPRHQPVLVEDHLHALFPQLPGLAGDVLVNPLTQFARPRRCVETRKFLLKLDAVHCPAALVADRRLGFGKCGIAISHVRHRTTSTYEGHELHNFAVGSGQ